MHLHVFALGLTPAAKAWFASCDSSKICSQIPWHSPCSLLECGPDFMTWLASIKWNVVEMKVWLGELGLKKLCGLSQSLSLSRSLSDHSLWGRPYSLFQGCSSSQIERPITWGTEASSQQPVLAGGLCEWIFLGANPPVFRQWNHAEFCTVTLWSTPRQNQLEFCPDSHRHYVEIFSIALISQFWDHRLYMKAYSHLHDRLVILTDNPLGATPQTKHEETFV